VRVPRGPGWIIYFRSHFVSGHSKSLGLSRLQDLHQQEVDPHVAEAATRMMKRGEFSISRLMKAVKVACSDAGVPAWAPGALRHSKASWLIAAGPSIEEVATWLHHDAATLRRHYLTAVIPKPRV